VVDSGGDEMDEETGVVELAIMIEDPTAETVLADGGEAGKGFFEGEDVRLAEVVLASEKVVDLHADAVEGGFPPGVVGDDEGEIVDEVRGVLEEQAALLEGFHDERDVALLEIADTAVDELGGATGGTFAEVLALDEKDVETAGAGIDSYASADGAAADDDDVPGVLALAGAEQHVFAVHVVSWGVGAFHAFERLTASCHFA
jgi:hypothetical protein